MNKVILLGRLCDNPVIRYAGERNSPVTSFTLAVSRDYKNAQGEYDTDFISCELWNKRAEVFCQYMSKGKLVWIEGSLRLDKFTIDTGETKYKIKVHVDGFSFIPLTKRKESNNTTFNSNQIFNDEIFDGEISESEIPF